MFFNKTSYQVMLQTIYSPSTSLKSWIDKFTRRPAMQSRTRTFKHREFIKIHMFPAKNYVMYNTHLV